MFDLDRYYTPIDLAEQVLSESGVVSSKLCIDSACGGGNLLMAVESNITSVKCVGLDNDGRAIKTLRRSKPSWILSQGDMFNPLSIARTKAQSEFSNCDLLFINPPFSQNNRKLLETNFDKQTIACSVAMAYVLNSIEHTNPDNALLIVPESTLSSDLDLKARVALEACYEMRELFDLRNTTFKGARVNSAVVQLTKRRVRRQVFHKYPVKIKNSLLTVVRGGLPVHLLEESEAGVPFLHSTDLVRQGSRKTEQRYSGRVKGWMVLLPRVGVPAQEAVTVKEFKKEIQLSDCVFAVLCKSEQDAKNIERMTKNREDFLKLYRGTAARYLTKRRLEDWLFSHFV